MIPEIGQQAFDIDAFMREARAAQSARGIPLSGVTYVSMAQNEAIIQQIANGRKVSPRFGEAGGIQALDELLIHFANLCNCNDIAVPEELWPKLARQLIGELAENVNGLGFQNAPRKLVPLTIYQGTGFLRQAQETEFADMSELLRREAVVYHPHDPCGFLRDVKSGKIAPSKLHRFKTYEVVVEEPELVGSAASTPSEQAFDIRGFMREARAAQAKRGKSLKGLKYPSSATMKAIAKYSDNGPALSPRFNYAGGADVLDTLLIRFGLLCERNGIAVREADWPEVARQLLEELAVNAAAFGLQEKPERLIPLTAYCGDDFSKIAQDAEFSDIAHSPWIFKLAAKNHPSDPRGFLCNVQKVMREMAAEPEFAGFVKTPWIFKFAAAVYSSDPRGFLRDVRDGRVDLQRSHGFKNRWVINESATVLVDSSQGPVL